MAGCGSLLSERLFNYLSKMIGHGWIKGAKKNIAE